MSKPPRCDENLISFEEASARLLKMAEEHKRTLKAKNILERSNKWRKNGKFEKEILRELDIARQKQMKLAEILCCDTESNLEGETLRARLTDQYYEPIESQITALTTFHSRTILVDFDRMSTENVVNLVTWLISEPSKLDVLQSLKFAFDDSYWKERINRVRQSSYLYEQIEKSKHVDILEFTSQILQHQNIMRGKSVNVVELDFGFFAKICINSEEQICGNGMSNPMIGHHTILFNIVNEEVFPNTFSDDHQKLPIFIAEISTNNGPEVNFSNPIETGYCNDDNILLFEPFVIKIDSQEE